MSPTQIGLTLATVFMLALGQVLFKLAAARIDPERIGWVASLLGNGVLWIALAVYGAATLAWLWVLRGAPLRVAYPFVGLAFVLVPLMSAWWLGEPLRWTSFAGAGLIMLGVWLSLQ